MLFKLSNLIGAVVVLYACLLSVAKSKSTPSCSRFTHVFPYKEKSSTKRKICSGPRAFTPAQIKSRAPPEIC